MSIKIISRKYNEIFGSGETDWLLGNVGDWQTASFDVEVGVDYLATQENPVQIDYVNNSFKLSNGDEWGQKGFDNGMEIIFRYKLSIDTTGDGEFDIEQTIQNTYTVTNVYDNVMEVQEAIDGNDFDNFPINFGNKKASEVLIFSTADIEGCKIRYGHIPNDDQSNNLNSVIDGTTTEFIYPQLNELNPGQWANLQSIGLQSGMSIRSAKIRPYAGNSDNIAASWQASNLDVKELYTDQLRVAKSVPMYLQNGELSEGFTNTLVPGDIPITNNAEGIILDGDASHRFLYNASETHTRDFYFNIDLRITDTNNSFPSDRLNLILLKYSNGTEMTFVSRTVLQSWNNPQSYINSLLNFNGIQEMTLNPSDSLVLAVESYIPDDWPTAGQTVYYKIENLFVQSTHKNQELSISEKRLYQIELKYMISSFFEDLSSIQNNQMPSYLTGDGSLTDNILLKFYPEWNNPNVLIKNDLDETKRLGNTGWFDENFNQLDNDFNIDSIDYFDSEGNPIESIDYTSQTKIKAEISGVPNLNSSTQCGFGFAWIPNSPDDYKNKSTPFHRNVFIQSGNTNEAFSLDTLYSENYYGYGTDGASMHSTDVKFSNVNGKIIFEATLYPNSQFTGIFDSKDENNRNYIIWFSVADGELPRNFSDRVSLLADFNQMKKYIPPAGSYDEIDNSFIEHPYSKDVEGVNVYKGFVQDDILCRIPFRIPKDGSTIFQKMTFGIQAFNIGTDESFELEKTEVDLTQFTIDTNGVQQLNHDSNRGFKLEPGNNKNWVKIKRESELDSSNYVGYLAFYALKIRYEDWIEKSNVLNDFFDSEELNNGYNNDWFHYLSQNGWGVNFFIKTQALVDSELLIYTNRFKLQFKDYDSNSLLIKRHNYFRHSDDTLLNVGVDSETGNNLGVILQNEPTRIEIEFEIDDSGTWDVQNTYSVTTIEIEKGPGIYEMRQLSSVWGSENDNPLIPLENETKLKMEVLSSGKVLKTSCLVDPDLLPENSKYRITGRVGCFDNQNEFVPGLYEFRYEDKYD